MAKHTLSNLVEQASKCAADVRASELKKEEKKANAEAKMEKEFKARQIRYLQKLLPWDQLGVDLTKLTPQLKTEDLFSMRKVDLAHLTQREVGTPFKLIASGRFKAILIDCEYEGSLSIVASYLTSHEQENLPREIHLNITGDWVKLCLPNESPEYEKLNLITLSKIMHGFVEDAKAKSAYQQKQKELRLRRSLDKDNLDSSRCEEIIAELERGAWPQKDIRKLLERAKVRLESIKAREADVLHDQQLLDKVWEMAKTHVAEWEAYEITCGQWAEQMIEEHWHPFTLLAVRYATEKNQSETAYCLSDKPDNDGYYQVVTPDGQIIHQRFCRPISWQKETFDVRPDISSASHYHYQIPTKWGSFTVSLPPADIDNSEIDSTEISKSQPSHPMSWSQRIETITAVLINKEWVSWIHELDPKDIAKSEMSTWGKRAGLTDSALVIRGLFV